MKAKDLIVDVHYIVASTANGLNEGDKVRHPGKRYFKIYNEDSGWRIILYEDLISLDNEFSVDVDYYKKEISKLDILRRRYYNIIKLSEEPDMLEVKP